MAHKKAGGSTRNGRDSESKRLGVKRLVVKQSLPVLFSSDNVEPKFTLARTLVWARITLCSRKLTELCGSWIVAPSNANLSKSFHQPDAE